MKLPFIDAGEIVTTHGVRGEMKLLPWTDGPDFLLEMHRVRIDGRDYGIQDCRIQKTCNLLKLEGIDSMEAAQAMKGKTVKVYREDVPEGLIFADELKHMQVFCDGELIGQITDVLDYPGNSVYVVKGQKEYMIPAVREFILNTDLDANRMDVRLIEGMAADEG